MDETWIHHFTPESNQQSVEGTAAGESHLKWPKTQTSASRVLASLFWDTQGSLFIDYLEKRTINSKFYTALLVRLKKEITKKRPQMKKKVLFHQDNPPCHKMIATMAKLHELRFELLHHPPYSPNLAPSDYWLFVDLKRMLQEKRFGSNKEVILETEVYFGPKTNHFYKKKRNQIVRDGISVSSKKETMLMNKIKFWLRVVFLLVRPRTYWVMC